jgi:glucokinase
VFLERVITGFSTIARQLEVPVRALSCSLPGTAEYRHGVVRQLPGLPERRGAVALGPVLEDHFGLPVFFSNGGALFALGEAAAGFLPFVNHLLTDAGICKRFSNIFGATLGPGLCGGAVHRGQLIRGDHAAAGRTNRMTTTLLPSRSAEETVSEGGIRQAYAREAGLDPARVPGLAHLYAIATGGIPGDGRAALSAFTEVAVAAGGLLANAVALLDGPVDGPVVVGGSLVKDRPLFLNRLVEEMNRCMTCRGADSPDLGATRVFNLEDPEGRAGFLRETGEEIAVPSSERTVFPDPVPRIGVGMSRLGTERAVALGAYVFALQQLDETATPEDETASPKSAGGRPAGGTPASPAPSAAASPAATPPGGAAEVNPGAAPEKDTMGVTVRTPTGPEHRPWGYYVVLEDAPTFKVKRIVVYPGSRLSLQRHTHRSEHWCIVEGEAEVTLERRQLRLSPGDSVDVPSGCTHRLANPGRVPLILIEIQQGDYFGEDDIVRVEDDFGRA